MKIKYKQSAQIQINIQINKSIYTSISIWREQEQSTDDSSLWGWQDPVI